MIKVGQIYKQKNSQKFVVSEIYGSIYSVVYNTGYVATYIDEDKNFQFVFNTLIAEYPTWQEAVNSKEFRE